MPFIKLFTNEDKLKQAKEKKLQNTTNGKPKSKPRPIKGGCCN